MTTRTRISQTPTSRTTINRNLRQEPKTKSVHVHHPVVDSKREWDSAERKSKTLATSKPQIEQKGKDLIVMYYIHFARNLHFEAVSLRKEEKEVGGG